GRARKTANRNASAVIDFSPPESSERRFAVLPAGVISISTPGPSPSSSSSSASASSPLPGVAPLSLRAPGARSACPPSTALLARQRIDGPELLAPPLQPLDARFDRLHLLLLQAGCLLGLRRRQLEALGDRAQLEPRLLGLVAQALRCHLCLGHRLCGLAQLRL